MSDINDLNGLKGEQDTPRRRRRRELFTEDDGLGEPAQPTEVIGRVTDEADIRETPEKAAEPVVQAADSRVPLEARRMSASPYGTDGAAVRRPGTRPMQAGRRPVQETRAVPAARRPIRSTETEDPDRTRVFNAGRVAASSRRQENGTSRVTVGYAPGRMSMPPRNAQENAGPRQIRTDHPDRTEQEYGRPARNPRTAQDYVRDIRSAQEYGRDPRQRDPRAGLRMKKHPVLWLIAALLVIIGLALIVILAMPEDNTVRAKAGEIAEGVISPIENLLAAKNPEAEKITAFTVTGNEKTTAPADVIFSVTTGSAVKELRLADEDGIDLEAVQTLAENSDSNYWTMTFRVKDGYEGLVRLQTRREDGEWKDTDYSAVLQIAPPLTAEAAAADQAQPEATAEVLNDATEAPAETAGDETETVGDETETAGDETETSGDETGGEDGEEPGEELGGEDAVEADEEPADYGDDMWGVPWNSTADTGAEITPEQTPEPTLTPEPTPEPTPTPPLEAEADPNVGNSLITNTTVYNGSKKVKSYVRPAKSLIHMPAGDDYTAKKIGVLTFRGNAFRQNAAVGEISSADGLTLLWTVEAGSSRGASQTFYGYEWTGQPAIVKWSTQVRQGSNIDEDKKNKNALREVIIAGVDGVIRFLDLEDGTATRGAISLGYPMKGAPSLHSAGYPYMNVGQYTRKMKTKTGTIGLRQYNLYNQKEQKLIDGLDGKLHRGINRIGSFETSALIDRTSDTVITLGTNGLLYLISLNTSFDYQKATLSTNTDTIVMSSRAKGEKKDELVAVESSHAMYDRYVFYADMGGILRCVDTNYLTTVWAVDTGDAVMSAVALDLDGEDRLDLYTANMLKNRKSGSAQIRKYNALSGTELWTVEIGVAKNTKTKEDVGVKASPVIGQHALSDLVFYTVTGLNAEGRSKLGVGEDAKAAVVALEKNSGRIRWAKALSERSESSPVAVYDAEGNGYIIQCAEDGLVVLLDGLTGAKRAELQVEGTILASPAVYNDIMVVGTSGKGTESVVGIKIK